MIPEQESYPGVWELMYKSGIQVSWSLMGMGRKIEAAWRNQGAYLHGRSPFR